MRTPGACHPGCVVTLRMMSSQAHGKDWDRLAAAVPGKTRPQIKNYYQVGFCPWVAQGWLGCSGLAQVSLLWREWVWGEAVKGLAPILH